MEIDEYLLALTDEEVREHLAAAVNDTKMAALELANSEWHAACFAAAVFYAQELNRRGLNRTLQ